MKVSKKKKNQWKQWLIMAFFAAIGGVCGLLLPSLTEQLLDADAPAWLELLVLCGSLLLLYVAMFLQLVIHEAGHLVFGLLSGYRFSSFRIGSFMLLSQGLQREAALKFRSSLFKGLRPSNARSVGRPPQRAKSPLRRLSFVSFSFAPLLPKEKRRTIKSNIM